MIPGFLASRLFAFLCLSRTGPETKCSLLLAPTPSRRKAKQQEQMGIRQAACQTEKLARFAALIRLLPMWTAEDGLPRFESRASRPGSFSVPTMSRNLGQNSLGHIEGPAALL